MAIAAYDSDLTTANGGLVSDASNAATWDESSNGGYDDGGSPVDETNFFIQGSSCVSAQFTKTGVGSILNIEGSLFDFTASDTHLLIWAFWSAPSSLETYANGGMRLLMGDSIGDFWYFNASGSDFEPNPYGGWYNFALCNDVAVRDGVVGSPTISYRVAGMSVNATAQSRGNPFAVDVIRIGRCTLEVTEGQAGDYGTFKGMSNFNDSSGERYALFQAGLGGYRYQGLMSLGLTGTAVDFRSSNVNIIVANTPKSSVDFNKIEVHNAGSNIEWTSVNISSPGVNEPIAATRSPGAFEVVDNATVVKTTCVFTDLTTFIYQGNSTLNQCTFRRCGLITVGGATFNGGLITNSIGAVSAITDNLSVFNKTEFESDGSNHAVELTSIGGGSMTWSGSTLGYDVGTTGSPIIPTSTGNEDIYLNFTSASDITINVAAGATTPSVRIGAGVTGNVNVVAGALVLKMIVKDQSGVEVVGAYAYIDNDNITPFILNSTTDANGEASISYSDGAVAGTTWRVRKYGYKPFLGTVDIAGSDITLPITLITDPQQT